MLSGVAPSRADRDPTAGRFELYVDRSGKYRFRLRNGEGVLAASAAFMTQAEAEEAIQALCRTVPSANIHDQTNGSAPATNGAAVASPAAGQHPDTPSSKRRPRGHDPSRTPGPS